MRRTTSVLLAVVLLVLLCSLPTVAQDDTYEVPFYLLDGIAAEYDIELVIVPSGNETGIAFMVEGGGRYFLKADIDYRGVPYVTTTLDEYLGAIEFISQYVPMIEEAGDLADSQDGFIERGEPVPEEYGYAFWEGASWRQRTNQGLFCVGNVGCNAWFRFAKSNTSEGFAVLMQYVEIDGVFRLSDEFSVEGFCDAIYISTLNTEEDPQNADEWIVTFSILSEPDLPDICNP